MKHKQIVLSNRKKVNGDKICLTVHEKLKYIEWSTTNDTIFYCKNLIDDTENMVFFVHTFGKGD